MAKRNCNWRDKIDHKKQQDYKIMQINTNRCKTAHDILHQTIKELNIDIILGQEQNKKLGSRYDRDKTNDTFIWTEKSVPTIGKGSNNGYTYVELEEFAIFTCYHSPNKPVDDFKNFLQELTNKVRTLQKDVIVGGDLNAKSKIFGAKKNDKRGEALEEFLVINEFIPINKGNVPTFANKNGTSVIDVTMAKGKIANRIKNWHVKVDTESMSPHRYIYYEIQKTKSENINNGKKRWRINDKKIKKTEDTLKEMENNIIKSCTKPEELDNVLKEICNKALGPKRGVSKGSKCMYWWTEEIRLQRDKCIAQRRVLTRINKQNHIIGDSSCEALDTYKEEKKS